jgi:hypothetical protein
MGLSALKICLDTNILIYFLEDIEPQASQTEKILGSFMKTDNAGVISTASLLKF